MTNEPHDHSGQGWYGGPDEYGDGRTAQPYGWGGESDADATAFVQLPPGGLPGAGPGPLAAPGTGQGGWEPPRIDPAAQTGTPTGIPMAPAAGTDPASTGQWTMPFAAQPHPGPPTAHPPFQPAEPADGGGADGAVGRGPAAALGQGAAAALAGSHEARTHRRPLGAGGAAATGDAGPGEPGEEAQYGGAQYGEAEERPQPAPSASWRAGQEAMLADALARRQVPLPGTGVPQQAPDWDGTAYATGHRLPDPARPAESAQPGPEGRAVDTGTTGHAWRPDEQRAPGPAGTPAHGFPAAPTGTADDGRWAAASREPHGGRTPEQYGTPGYGFPAAHDRDDTALPDQGAAWHGAPESRLSADSAAAPGPASYSQGTGHAHAGSQGGTFPPAPRYDTPDPAGRLHLAATQVPEWETGPPAAGQDLRAAPEAATGEPMPPADAGAVAEPPESRQFVDGAETAPEGPGVGGSADRPESGPPEPAEDAGRPSAEPVPTAFGTASAAEPGPVPEADATADVPQAPEPYGLPDTVSDHPHTSYLLHVNGADRPVSDAWIGESLLYVLRERLGLAGAKDGCSQGECGACSVRVDGRLLAACLVPAATAVGMDIRTVEGLAGDDGPSDVQRALTASGAVQCGFCVPGIAMAVHDLLEGNHAPTELETRQALCGNLCRCSGYRGVLDAVQQVAAERADRSARDAARTEAAEAAQRAGAPQIPQQAQYGGGEGIR